MATDYKAKAAEVTKKTTAAMKAVDDRIETFSTAKGNAQTAQKVFCKQRAENLRLRNSYKANHAAQQKPLGEAAKNESYLASADKNGAGEQKKKQLQAQLATNAKHARVIFAKQTAVHKEYTGSQIPSTVAKAEAVKAI